MLSKRSPVPNKKKLPQILRLLLVLIKPKKEGAMFNSLESVCLQPFLNLMDATRSNHIICEEHPSYVRIA